MLFPLGNSTKDGIVRILSISWPLSAVKIWNALSREKYNVSYKAVFKALKELNEEKIVEKINNEYKLKEEWLKINANNALDILKGYNIKKGEAQTTANITLYKFADEFYRILVRMLKTSNEIRLAGKTPALFLKTEATASFLRREYTKTLWDKIKAGEKVFYLFPTEVAVSVMQREGRKKMLTRLEEIEPYPNLQIRHAPRDSLIKMAITKNEAMIGLASPPQSDLGGFLKIEGSSLGDIIEYYDLVFSHARRVSSLL